MATGDLAASKGLKTYTSAQDRRLGYDNDNQRGDDIAAAMLRLDALEKTGGNRPTVILRKGNDQNTPDTANAWGAVTWDVEEYDPANLHDAVVNRETVVLPSNGTVSVNALVKIGTTNAGHVARVRLTRNNVPVPGTSIDDKTGNPVPAEPLPALNTMLAVSAGDVLRIEVSTNYGRLPIRQDQCRWSVAYNTLT
jgi:hypothetical protein